MAIDYSLDWAALLIGGPSGAGKSTAAKQIARQYGIPWLQVDDLRLALLESQVTLPDPTDTHKLYFFDERPDVWQQPLEQLRDGFIGVGEALSPAIAKVVTNHVATAEPVVLEGDGILPSLLARPDVRQYGAGRRIRAVFIVPPDEHGMLAKMRARGLGLWGRDEQELDTHARANWLYGMWLADEARRHGLPVVEPQPWATLVERIVAATGTMAGPLEPGP
jgi:2-phosphoglycerate kinase